MRPGHVGGPGGSRGRNRGPAGWHLYRLWRAAIPPSGRLQPWLPFRAPTAWGRGFASEISREALRAGGEVAPQLAITARVLTSNPASAAVLEKVGLSLHWEGVRAGEGSAGSAPAAPLRRIYADRPLNEALHNWLVRNA